MGCTPCVRACKGPFVPLKWVAPPCVRACKDPFVPLKWVAARYLEVCLFSAPTLLGIRIGALIIQLFSPLNIWSATGSLFRFLLHNFSFQFKPICIFGGGGEQIQP